MTPIQKLLCPTDLSEYSQPILAMACTWAKQSEAELHLLHVVDGLMNPTPYLGPPFDECSDWEMVVQQRAQKALEEFALPAEFQDVPVVRVLRMGSCATTIVQYASQAEIDLIVMGTHGRTGLSHLLLGSLAENVASRVSCSVLTVHPLSDAEKAA